MYLNGLRVPYKPFSPADPDYITLPSVGLAICTNRGSAAAEGRTPLKPRSSETDCPSLHSKPEVVRHVNIQHSKDRSVADGEERRKRPEILQD
ncbi:hypothetical protein PoB_002991700 [Plakobranchus ocellatus]|uniref:Uncharacterized protein n=1 Tax=Plakobranchus ocellatus TaxID=259542 RepID=A0AAV4A823_9GAST|nr:hypothetical protein PoB_002991700 [Plakobranchus ocellatus]